MKINKSIFLIFCIVCNYALAQHTMHIDAVVLNDLKTISIEQKIQFVNTTDKPLQVIYLNDWNHSYSGKYTPLGNRFAEEFNSVFHFAKDEERGFTTINSITTKNVSLQFSRLKNALDIVKVNLDNPLKIDDSVTLNLLYKLQLPSSKFTRYGITKSKDLHLRYWYLTPSTHKTEWQYYSNKDLDDLFLETHHLNLTLTYPKQYTLNTSYNTILKDTTGLTIKQTLEATHTKSTKLFLEHTTNFNTINTNLVNIISNLDDKDITQADKVLLTNKVTGFIKDNLGEFPSKNMLVTQIDYKKNPIYGLNLLPDFLRPFPDTFQYELKLLKITLQNYLEETLNLNPRKEQWLLDGIQAYYLIKYVETYYKDIKLLGNFTKIWGVKWFHLSKLKFNEQYNLMYLNMARSNLDQALTTPKDSLLKFNKNIANKYKAGAGLNLLNVYLENNIVETTIKEFIQNKKNTSADFKTLLKNKTNKDISWFFNEFINANKPIDYKIKSVETKQDSITITIKNKTNSTIPVTLYGFNKQKQVYKTWINPSKKQLTIPKQNIDNIALNANKLAPEFNQRNNYKKVKKTVLNKPFQLRLIKDVEDPTKNQLFLMPLVEFNNIYDGVTIGGKLYNKSILRKLLRYQIAPQYGTRSKNLTGSASIFKTHYFKNTNLYNITYGIRGQYESFAQDLFFTSITPSIKFQFRDKTDLRSNKRQFLDVKYISIQRDQDPTGLLNLQEEPNYSVFNARYLNSDTNLITAKRWFADFQIADKFGKLSFNYKYRKLFSNRQISLRLFGGLFLYNNTNASSNYFSFALDRPTDYLFNYNYLGRSENSGIFSQQLIIAEGGFKSKLQPAFANQWLTTANVSASIWRHFQVYGDVGFVKNKNSSSQFVYDAGFRLNLVQDYFEVYFPVYSNLGWEISHSNYSEKIRFVFTVDPQALLGIFRRKWY